jgi:hypothetical protein
MTAKITNSYINNIYICVFLFLSLHSFSLNGQIVLPNASFEEEPADATTPMGWLPCAEFTTPDILPGFWGVYTDASEGDTYVGLITRDNGTFESISTRCSADMLAGICYEFRLDLAHSKTYSGFNKVIQLKIWIGEEKCDKDQMIFFSEKVKNSDWEQHKIKFTPKKDARYLHLEAYYKDGSFAHKGNILIDNISPIVFCKGA